MLLAYLKLLAVLLVSVGLIVFMRRAGTRGPGAGTAPKRRIVTRVICGVLGILILAAAAVGTRQEVLRSYAEAAEAANIPVRVASLPRPDFPGIPDAGSAVPVDSCRFLLKFLVGDQTLGVIRPVQVKEFELQWPKDRGRRVEAGLSLPGWTLSFAFHLNGVTAWRSADGRGVEVVASAHNDFNLDAPHHRSSGTIETYSEVVRLDEAGTHVDETPLLSVTPAPRAEWIAYQLLMPVRQDDPLKTVSLAQFVSSFEPSLRKEQSDWEQELRRAIPIQNESPPISAGGPALAARLGQSSLLLLAAALLLAQLFARRSLAFAGILACIVLYVALLDRAVLASQLARLSDRNSIIETRLTACAGVAGTFFFRQTASAGLDKVAHDQSAPPTLREAAGRMHNYLRPPEANQSRVPSPPGRSPVCPPLCDRPSLSAFAVTPAHHRKPFFFARALICAHRRKLMSICALCGSPCRSCRSPSDQPVVLRGRSSPACGGCLGGETVVVVPSCRRGSAFVGAFSRLYGEAPSHSSGGLNRSRWK